MNVLKSVTGKSYQLVTLQDGGRIQLQKALYFSELDSAKRFLRSLMVEQHFWRRYCKVVDLSNPNSIRDAEYIEYVAQMLVKGSIKAAEVHVPDKHVSPNSKRTVKAMGGKSIAFLSPAEIPANQAQKAKQFSSAQDAQRFLQGLNIPSETLDAIVQALPPAKSVSDKSQAVALALAEGKIVAREVVRFGPTAKGKADAAAANDVPGAKPVELAPASEAESKPAEKTETKKTDSDADQADALVEAAETGAMFCEDCAEKEKNEAAA